MFVSTNRITYKMLTYLHTACRGTEDTLYIKTFRAESDISQLVHNSLRCCVLRIFIQCTLFCSRLSLWFAIFCVENFQLNVTAGANHAFFQHLFGLWLCVFLFSFFISVWSSLYFCIAIAWYNREIFLNCFFPFL